MSFTVLILSPDEEPLEYLDSEQCELEEVHEEKELRRLSLTYPLGDDIHHIKELFKMGNKIWVPGINNNDSCLYVISNSTKFDFWDGNYIQVEPEEVLVELNYVAPFEQGATETVTIDRSFLETQFGNYFIIGTVDDCLTNDLKKVSLNGTMTKLELLRYIEEETSNVFVTEYEKDANSNVIHRYLHFKRPDNLGRDLDTVIDLSFNAENIEFEQDESDTYKAMAPLFSLDNNENGTRNDLQNVINSWKGLSVTKGSQVPMIIEKVESNSALSTSNGPYPYCVLISHEDNKYTYNQATAFRAAPFKKNSGELFIRDDIDTDVDYVEVKSRKDNSTSVIVPKIGTLETSETDKYVIYNLCVNKLIEKRYSDINLEVEVKDIEQITDGNIGFQLYDKLRVKVPDSVQAITAQVLSLTKNFHLPGETKVTLGNANIGTRINQVATKFTDVGINKSSVSGKLRDSSDNLLNNKFITVFIHRDEVTFTQKVKVTTDTVTTVKGNTTTVKTYENGTLIKTVTKTKTGNKLKTVTTTADGKSTTKITTTTGTTTTKNNLDRDVSTKNGKVSKATQSTRVYNGSKKSKTSAGAPLLTVSGKPSGSKTGSYAYKVYTKTWRNWCPLCGRVGSLSVNPKGVREGELTCGNGNSHSKTGCHADFDIVTGLDKSWKVRDGLRDANGNHNTKNSIKTSIGNAKTSTKTNNTTTNKNSTTKKSTNSTKDITTTIPEFNKAYNVKTNSNGVFNLKLNLEPGTYKITISYGGAIEYGSISKGPLTLTI